jgi:hypothetical protein
MYIECILLSVVTCISTELARAFRRYRCLSVLPMDTCYLAWAALISISCGWFLGSVLVFFVITVMILVFYCCLLIFFDILWPAPWLCFCFVHYYRNDVSCLVLFTDLLVGV